MEISPAYGAVKHWDVNDAAADSGATGTTDTWDTGSAPNWNTDNTAGT